MSARDKIALLESLLVRVQRKASRPRAGVAQARAAGAAAPVPAAVADALEAAAAASVAPLSPMAAESATISASDQGDGAGAPLDDWLNQATQVAPDVVADALAEDDVQDLELLEEDIVDITLDEPIEELPVRASAIGSGSEAPPATTAVASPRGLDVDIDFDDEEQPPSSSRRPKQVSGIDEALAGAAEELDQEEREVPLKTPPPESGPQEAVPPAQVLVQSPPPRLELEEPGSALEQERAAAAAHGPTTEQLGNTIELEEARGPALELDALPVAPAPVPERAREELEAELRPPVQSPPAPAPEPTPVMPVSEPSPPPAAEAREAPPAEPVPSSVRPEVVTRPADTPPSDAVLFAQAHRSFQPATFAELLDASLELGD